MSSLLKYNITTGWTSLLTTGLNSLANTATSGASTTLSNGTSLDVLLDVSINLASVNPSNTTPWVEIHLLPLSGDGTTFADKTATTLVGAIQINTGTSAKVGVLVGIVVPPGDFKLMVVNQLGSSFASSGNVLYYRLYEYNLNG